MLIARPTYQKWLWDLKDQNLIKVLTGVRRVGKHILPLNFPEYLEMIKNIDNSSHNDFRNSQNFSVSKSFGNFIYYGSIPEAVSLHSTNKNASLADFIYSGGSPQAVEGNDNG